MEVKVLIADDSAPLRQAFSALLSTTEMVVVAEAATGEDAIRAAMESDIDLVILDVRMPDGDGFYALERIKKQKPSLPCVMHGAEYSKTLVKRAESLGANGYLAKGADWELFWAVLGGALGDGLVDRV